MGGPNVVAMVSVLLISLFAAAIWGEQPRRKKLGELFVSLGLCIHN